jgi:hypothetical protein
MDVDPKGSDDAVGGLLALKSPNVPPSTLSLAASQSHTQSNEPTNGNLKGELATSPTIRDYTISTYGSTLPAITSMPPPNSPPQPNSIAASHGERPNLPSLHSHLNQLAEAAEKESTQPFDVRTNGASSGTRPSFPSVVVGAARSPPATQAGLPGSGRPRVQYMTTHEQQKYIQNSPQANHYPSSSQYSQAQTSPVSSYSETSPQEPFPHGRELPSLSPPPGPGGPVSHPYWFNRRPSQASENGPPYAPVPQAESSYPPPPTTDGSTPASVGGTPRDHRMSIDETPHPTPTASLTPQQSGPPPVGGFRCDHAGCTAPPFQTQYLLK